MLAETISELMPLYIITFVILFGGLFYKYKTKIFDFIKITFIGYKPYKMKLISDDEIKFVKYIFPAVFCLFIISYVMKEIQDNQVLVKVIIGISLLIASCFVTKFLATPCEFVYKFLRNKAENNKFFRFLSHLLYILTFIAALCLIQTPYNL